MLDIISAEILLVLVVKYCTRVIKCSDEWKMTRNIVLPWNMAANTVPAWSPPFSTDFLLCRIVSPGTCWLLCVFTGTWGHPSHVSCASVFSVQLSPVCPSFPLGRIQSSCTGDSGRTKTCIDECVCCLAVRLAQYHLCYLCIFHWKAAQLQWSFVKDMTAKMATRVIKFG